MSYNHLQPSQEGENPLESGVYDISELEEKVTKLSQWACVGDNIFKAVGITSDKLKSACYSITLDTRDETPLYVRSVLKSDLILKFKGDLTSKFMLEINDFWGKEEAFKANGFLHRRGYLLYGSQGTGKSSMVRQVASDVVRRGGIVFFCDNPRFFTKGLAAFRRVEPKRAIVCVFEDIDAIIAKYGEAEILSLLDGDNQIDRVINIATTNYPERLDKRIVSRPRRFDRVHKIEVPTNEVRIQFLTAKIPKGQGHNRAEWIKKTEGLSFAGLTECLISVLCLGNDLDSTVKTLKELEANTPKIAEFGGAVGFKVPGKDED